jgi:acyl-CoA dehydrogenase
MEMDFILNEEQEMIKKSIREFMEKECPREYVREHDEQEKFPSDLFQKMARMGWLGLPFPEKYGGSGYGVMEVALLLEELGRAMRAAGTVYLVSVIFGGESILNFGNEDQKGLFLPKICRGEVKFALALTEPDSGSDAASLSTSAVLRGDNYFINGSKTFITGAMEADWLIVVARTDETVSKYEGITIFLVNRKTPGIEINKIRKLGVRAVDFNEISFDNAQVNKENILGILNKGWQHIQTTLEMERIGIAASSVGNAQLIVEDALQYSKKRMQFGKPIGKFQMIQKMLADMQTEVDAARLLTYRAAWMKDKGIYCLKEASMAKLFASDVCMRCAIQGMEILGGYGYTMEYDMQRYFRDAQQNKIGGGTSEIQRIIIAQEMSK